MAGMRRKEKEVEGLDGIEAIIRDARVIRLGLCDNGFPYIVPVCFGYEPGTLWIHSAYEGKKIDVLKRNPRICFEMDDVQGIVKDDNPCRWGINYRSVIGTGIAEFVEDPVEKSRGLACILNQYSEGTSAVFSTQQASNVCILRIRIMEMTGKQSL